MTNYETPRKSAGVKMNTPPTLPLSYSSKSTRSLYSSKSIRSLRFSNSSRSIYSPITGSSRKINSIRGDRFTASRRNTDYELCRRALFSSAKKLGAQTFERQEYNEAVDGTKHMLMSSLLGVPSAKLDKHGEPKRLLSYGRKSNVNQEILGSRAFGKPGRKHLFWNDDKPNPYLPGHDILSWNQHNHFCFGFGQHLTLINVDNMDRSISWNLKELYGISSIACVANCQIPGKEHLLTLRTSDGTTCIWDINSEQIVDAVRPREKDQGYALLHAPCLDWNKHSGLLTTNSPYKSEILHRDHRDLRGIVQRISNRYFASCSRIKWNCDGTAMASTGGDCGMVHIWDAATTKDDKPRVHLDHYMAVTMDWHPSRPNLLLSGSVRPILEQTIKLWDTGSGNLKATIDTEEATSYVLWNQEGDQFCSSHGTFDSPHYYANVPFKTLKNSELKNWKFDGVHGLTQRKSFNKICGGIYCLAQSPDGNRIGALHDGAISVWNGVFGSNLEASEQLQHFTSSNAKRRKDCNDNIWPFGTSQLGGMPVIR